MECFDERRFVDDKPILTELDGAKIKRRLLGILRSRGQVTQEKIYQAVCERVGSCREEEVLALVERKGIPLPRGKVLTARPINPTSYFGRDRIYELAVKRDRSHITFKYSA